MNYIFKNFIFLVFFLSISLNSVKAEIAFSFDNVNLVSVVNMLMPEINKTIIIDKDIISNITLIIKHPVNEKKIISALQTSLDLEGLVLFENINGEIIIKKNTNIKENIPISQKGLLGMQLFILKLKSTTVEKMLPFLSQFFPEKNTFNASPNGQSFSFIGNKKDYERLKKLLKSFDLKSKQEVIRIRLNNSKSNEIVSIVRTLIESGNWLINPENNVSLVNIENSNSIIISAPKNSLSQIKSFITDLDGIEIKKLIKKIDTKPKKLLKDKDLTKTYYNPLGFDVIDLKYSIASEIEETISDLLLNNIANFDNNDNESIISTNKISIKTYLSGNQLIISGLNSDRKKIIELIETLDVPVKQVFVEAIVAEVSTSTARELGLQFSGSTDNSGLTVLNSNSLGSNIRSSAGGFISDGIGLTLGPGAKQIKNIGALINLIENDGNSEILATPTLLAMNNKQAQILVGSNIPIITGKYTQNSKDSTSSPFQTISRQDVGIIFKIKPIIGSEGFITIEMQQEVSELDTSSALASDIVTTKRAIETSAVVRTGNTLVVGGLINETTQFLGAKIPILGNLPIFKEIFNQRRLSTSKRNLVIFLKPTIVNNNSVSEHTMEKYLQLKEQMEKSRSSNYFKLDYPPLPFIENTQ